MSKLKKYGHDEKDLNLKRADQKKIQGGSDSGVTHAGDFFGDKKISNRELSGSNIKVKKKLPLAVDIIVGILMLALIGVVIVGSYMLFRYYANAHETREVTYTVILNVDEGIGSFNDTMKNKELFIDKEGNSLYFGKIVGVKSYPSSKDAGRVELTVISSVEYRNGEGYFIEDCRLAIGSVITVRYTDSIYTVTVVDMNDSREDDKNKTNDQEGK